MSDDLVKFQLPAAFIAPRVLLTPGELTYGYTHDWLSDREVVALALAALESTARLPPAEEELALLLSDQLDRVPELVETLARSPEVLAEHDPREVWLFLALAWLHEHRSDHADPFQVIESLYADFGYPETIEDLVRFMPAPPGAAVGPEALEERWWDFLQARSAELRARGQRS